MRIAVPDRGPALGDVTGPLVARLRLVQSHSQVRLVPYAARDNDDAVCVIGAVEDSR